MRSAQINLLLPLEQAKGTLSKCRRVVRTIPFPSESHCQRTFREGTKTPNPVNPTETDFPSLVRLASWRPAKLPQPAPPRQRFFSTFFTFFRQPPQPIDFKREISQKSPSKNTRPRTIPQQIRHPGAANPMNPAAQ
jgi:hypothetical protein